MSGQATTGSASQEQGRSGPNEGGSAASCRNAIKDGARSRKEFPDDMQEAIDQRIARLTADRRPKTEVERILIIELARSSVQVEVCNRRVLDDARRVLSELDSSWDDQRSQEAQKVGARLGRDAFRVAGMLEQSKQGVNWLLYHWRLLDETVVLNGGVNDAQRQLMFDLKGVPSMLRDTTARVPAGDDAEALLTLVAGEIARLERRLEDALNRRDQVALAGARRGLPVMNDPVTRRLKSDEARAHKRMVWAMESLLRVQAGAKPETVIDPETRAPVGGQAKPAPDREPAPTPTPTPTSPTAETPAGDAPAAPPDDRPIPDMPEEISAEDREMLLIVGEHLRQMFRSAGINPLSGTDGEPQPQPPPETTPSPS
jgi:hypothetical protein